MPTKTIILAAFATAAIFGASAGNAKNIDAIAVRTAPVATARADNPDQRYCIVNDAADSRMVRRECRRLGTWLTFGIDPRLMPRRW